jgi:hypothetical protein
MCASSWTLKPSVIETIAAPKDGSAMKRRVSERNTEPNSNNRPPIVIMCGVSSMESPSIVHTIMLPGCGGDDPGLPFTRAINAFDLGLKRIWEADPGGPSAGVVSLNSGSNPKALAPMSPCSGSTVKQVTPALLPPLRTHAKHSQRGAKGGPSAQD